MSGDKRNARSERTRDAIREACRKMLASGEGEITVSSVAARAGIHRKTFYLHYGCIEDLYEDLVNQVASEYAAEVGELGIPYDYRDLSRVLFGFFTRDEFAGALIENPACAEMMDRVVPRMLAGNRAAYNPFEGLPAEEQDLVNTFATRASNEFLRRWLKTGRRVPQESAARLLGDLLENGVSQFRMRS